MQVQAVDAGDGHPLREQAGDDQRGELAAAADQHQDVARREPPAGRGEDRRLLDQLADPRRERFGIMPIAKLDPALLALVCLLVRLLHRGRRP